MFDAVVDPVAVLVTEAGLSGAQPFPLLFLCPRSSGRIARLRERCL
jgi:hypothetical protein